MFLEGDGMIGKHFIPEIRYSPERMFFLSRSPIEVKEILLP